MWLSTVSQSKFVYPATKCVGKTYLHYVRYIPNHLYSRHQKKKFPFHLCATTVLQCEHLRCVLRSRSVLRLLIQQLLPSGVSGWTCRCLSLWRVNSVNITEIIPVNRDRSTMTFGYRHFEFGYRNLKFGYRHFKFGCTKSKFGYT